MKHIFSKVLLLLIVVSIGVSVSMVAYSAKSFNKTVQLISGRADTVDLAGAVADVLVADPSIADVGTLRADRLYIVGRKVGDTNVLAYDEVGNQLANITIHVRVDDKNLQKTLKEFFPDEKIAAKTVKENIVLSGTVSSPLISAQVRDLATRFMIDKEQTLVDLMTVKGKQQVMLKVKVIEARRSVLRDFGIETDFRTASTNGFIMNAGDVGRAVLTPFGSGALLVGKKGQFGPLTATIRALEQNGLVNTLAEPTLTAISGETAGFLAGGEYPVPTGRDSTGNVIIEFKQFGVSLNFTPTVLNKERIALHMSTEVSEKDSTNGVTLVDVQIDGLRVRRAETTVEMGSGGTLMIAGLLKSDTLHALNGMPGLEDLPILGHLFKSKSFSRNESELVIIVTPYLVDPYAEPEAVVVADKPFVVASTASQGKKKPSEQKVKVTAMSPLSQRFMENLKKTYGNRVSEKASFGAGFGYIID
ncbi:MAG: type II and III secretion system protein family protein [Alphaproteobacteria bacterium]|nr:type II and III secretion system protein family protein [Alphaproteobacteria bacterium]MCK5554640.1 type II and III secretion system protein family protein [Alphaproteobacteria bacterium]